MAVVYSIREWKKHYECAQSKKVAGPLSWFPMPTKHDGLSYRRIMARTDGPVVYAAWVLILAVAAKCLPTRGRLCDASGPYSAADLELKTGCPAAIFETALNVLSSKEIGWIVVAKWEQSGATGQDITGQDNESGVPDSSAELGDQASTAVELSEFVFPTTGKGAQEWSLTKAKLAEYVAAYPGLDVVSQFRSARQWCRDKPRQRKTPAGMPAFLTGWLSRSQNRGAGRGGPEEKPKDYKTVSHEEFTEHVKMDRFKIRPIADPPLPDGRRRWFGELRDGSKLETFTAPKATAP
jgi:hypothetical protein